MFTVKHWTRIASVAALAALAAISLASPSQAASSQISTASDMRDCVRTSLPGCGKVGTWAAGTNVSMTCWTDDSRESSSVRWFYVTAGSKKGFVHSSRVKNQANVPNCKTHAGISASRWAAEHVGFAKMTSGEAGHVGAGPWWSGLCAGFSSAAHALGEARNTPKHTGHPTAKSWYAAYQKSKDIRPMSTEPTIGSLVFWPTISEAGHVAIYAGNGFITTTEGYPGDRFNNVRKSLKSFSKTAPVGWVHPDNV